MDASGRKGIGMAAKCIPWHNASTAIFMASKEEEVVVIVGGGGRGYDTECDNKICENELKENKMDSTG